MSRGRRRESPVPARWASTSQAHDPVMAGVWLAASVGLAVEAAIVAGIGAGFAVADWRLSGRALAALATAAVPAVMTLFAWRLRRHAITGPRHASQRDPVYDAVEARALDEYPVEHQPPLPNRRPHQPRRVVRPARRDNDDSTGLPPVRYGGIDEDVTFERPGGERT